MTELNSAYRVLSDPVARYRYDRVLQDQAASGAAPVPPQSAPPGAGSDHVSDFVSLSGPARFPWRMVVIGSIVGAVVVIGISAARGPARVPQPDGVLRPDSCVEIEPNTDVHEVNCGQGPNLVVRSIVGFDERCPTGTMGHRDRQGSGTACIAEVTG